MSPAKLALVRPLTEQQIEREISRSSVRPPVVTCRRDGLIYAEIITLPRFKAVAQYTTYIKRSSTA